MTALILFAAAGGDVPADLLAARSGRCRCLRFSLPRWRPRFPLGWAVVGDLFGRKHYAKIRGYMVLFYTWGGVLGPVIAGAIFDRWQTYEPLLWSLVGRVHRGGTVLRKSQPILAESDGPVTRGELTSHGSARK